jgi:hypothetical protein
MSAKYICDNCGKEAPATNLGGEWAKPNRWLQRKGAYGIHDACSIACFEKIAAIAERARIVARR